MELGFDENEKAVLFDTDALCENCCAAECEACTETPSFFKVLFSGVQPCTCKAHSYYYWRFDSSVDYAINILNSTTFKVPQTGPCSWSLAVPIPEVKFNAYTDAGCQTFMGTMRRMYYLNIYITRAKSTSSAGNFRLLVRIGEMPLNEGNSDYFTFFDSDYVPMEDGPCCISPLENSFPKPPFGIECELYYSHLSGGGYGVAYIEECQDNVCPYCEEVGATTPPYLSVTLSGLSACCWGIEYPYIYGKADMTPNGVYILPRIANSCRYLLVSAFSYKNDYYLGSDCITPYHPGITTHWCDIEVRLSRNLITINGPFSGSVAPSSGCATGIITCSDCNFYSSRVFSNGQASIAPYG